MNGTVSAVAINMINIGCHLSSAEGFSSMAKTAVKIGANTFQYFTRNPRGGAAKKIVSQDVQSFLQIARENNFAPVIAHAPYTLNLCSSAEHIRNFSQNILCDDISRAELIPGSFYNLHPGSHTGQGIEIGTQQIANALNFALKPNGSVTVLLETMAGKGSEIGGSFEELAGIISCVELHDKVGVCLDTCHVFDGGYDIVNNLESVLEDFNNIIGFSRLKAVHLNDSKNFCGSKKDRHEQIGKGFIGIETIEKIINHPMLKGLPFILETPQESIEGYASEISSLRALYR